MGNIKTCIDTSRQRSTEDEEILEERFAQLDEARKHLYDPDNGTFRTMAEAMEKVTTTKNK